MKKTKLTVCMISRNEEKCIGQAINSVMPVADEIIINDTGSTDGTLDILSKYGDTVRVMHTKWDDDFSKARNLSLKFASCDWIMFLDCDDILPPTSIKRINQLKNDPLDRYFYFKVICTKNGLPIGSSLLQARMFPNRADVNFIYPIHEQISVKALKAGLKPMTSDVSIHHTGYEDEGVNEDKQDRNINIIKSIPGWGKTYYWLKCMGDSHMVLRRWDKARTYYSDASFIESTAYIHSQIGKVDSILKNTKRAISHHKLALFLEPDSIEAMYSLAKCYEEDKNYEQAVLTYRKVLTLPDKESYATVPYDMARLYTYHFLLRIYIGFGVRDEAAKLIKKMSEDYPKQRLEDV